jgi:heavy metal translocating P-type ATPase
MFAALLLIGGAALYALEAYQKHSKKKKIAKFLHSTPELSIADRMKVAIREKLPFSDARSKQLEIILSDEEKQRRREQQKRIDQGIIIASVSLGFATAGKFFWPLNLLSLPAIVYVPMPLYQRAYQLLKEGKVGVPTLFTIAAIGGTVFGYFWISCFAVLLFAVAFKFSSKVTEDSRNRLINVFRQSPKLAWVLVDGVEVQVPFEALEVGQIVIVNAGETIPVDGAIIKGMATIDQRILTGESRPVEKEPGDQVYAATLVLSGRLYIKVEKAGDETTVAQIGQILNNTIEYKATVQLRAQTLADRTVPPTLMAGAVALPILGPMGALAVIDAHFKNKMNTLVPLSLMNFLNLASQQGILIKDGRSLDLLSQIDTIVFDKTGTLTEEQPHVGPIHTCTNIEEHQLLLYAAAAEEKQTHPIAKAILEEAHKRQLSYPPIDAAEYKVGYGITVKIEDRLVQIGSNRFMEVLGRTIPPNLKHIQENCHLQGHSLVMMAIDKAVVGAIELLPTVRPEAKSIISELRRRPTIKASYIISGDNETPTKKLAEELGIDHYFAETLPEEKADIIQQLIDAGRSVCYVGDGINDAIALKKSHVSISLRGASTVAVDTAQIIMMNGDLQGLVSIFDFAQDFRTNTNITFAIVLIPTLIGMGGAFFLHYGMLHTTLLNLAGLFAGISNSMMPLVKYRQRSIDQWPGKTSSRQKIIENWQNSTISGPGTMTGT